MGQQRPQVFKGRQSLNNSGHLILYVCVHAVMRQLTRMHMSAGRQRCLMPSRHMA